MLTGRAMLGGFIAGSLAMLAGAPARVAAQGTPPKPVTTIPAVEVVATRIPEAPHDVPASVEVVSGADLRARGVVSLRDALSLATGISIAPGGDAGPASAVPEIWGLREFDAFLLVVDGIPWGGAFNPSVSTLSLRDVERIEILRGPAPVTYGATSFVGVINVVHKAAAASNKYLSVSGGSFGSVSASADFVPPMTARFTSRATVDFDKQGFMDDRTSFTRGHGLWRSSMVEGNRKAWFSGDLTILQQDPASPHPREGKMLSTATPLDANYNPSGAHVNENRFALSAGLELPIAHDIVWGTTASYTFSSQDIFRGFLTDISNSPNNASGFKETIDVNHLYADSHLIWPERSHVRFMVGADMLFANGEAEGATFTYTAPLSGTSAAAVSEPTKLDKDAANRRLFAGGYGSVEWRPVPRFTLSAGLRLNVTNETRGDAGEDATHTRLSGSVGAMYGLWEQGPDHVRVFANVRDTFKPAAFDFSLAEDEGALEPETSRSYEGGLKIRAMDGRFDAELSAFQMNFQNLVTSTVVNNLPALVNAGSTRFQGFELGVDLRLAGATWARASYSAHDGKFVDFVMAFDGVPTQLAGKRFEMSAKQMYSAGIALSPDEGFIASAGMNYVGDRYLNKRNTALVPGYSTFDVGVAYRTSRAEFRLDGRNLGNARDAVSESEFGDAQYYRMSAQTFRAGVVVRY